MPQSYSIATALAEKFVQYKAQIEQIARQLRAHKKLIDLCPIPSFLANSIGDCVYINRVFCGIVGTDVFHMQGTGWKDYILSSDSERVSKEWYNFVLDAKQRTFELDVTFSRRDGRTMTALVKAEQMDDTSIVGFAIPLHFEHFVEWIRGSDLSSLPAL
jgi:PAS domain S-box-containing protein